MAEMLQTQPCISNLGLVIADRGDFATAETLFRQALAVRRKALGPTHPALAVALNNLAYSLREERKYEEAVAALEEALALSVRAKGDDGPVVATYQTNLARVHLAKGDAATAEPLFRRSLAVRLRTFGENDWPLLLDAKRTLKDLPGAQGREAKATVTRLQTLYESWGRPERLAAADRRGLTGGSLRDTIGK
jgi:tetratricopeptide (TPR) repeat protein